MSQKTPLVAGFSVRLGRDRGGCDAFHDSEIGFTLRVSRGHGFKRAGRIVFRADDERLTPYAGLAVIGVIVSYFPRNNSVLGSPDRQWGLETPPYVSLPRFRCNAGGVPFSRLSGGSS